MAQLEKRNLTRVNMNLPTNIVKQVKEYANDLGLPITQAYTVLINSGLQHEEMTKMLPYLLNRPQEANIMPTINKASNNGI